MQQFLQDWEQSNWQDARDSATRNEIRNTRKEIKDTHVKRITPCDGVSTTAVREWLQEIDITVPHCRQHPDLVITIACLTSIGSLHREIERFLLQNQNQNITWLVLRTHLRDAFLSANEEEALRRDVEKMQQTQYENAASYSRRFRDASDSAYPGPRNPDQQRILLRIYAKGLRSSATARRLVEQGHPQNIDQAIALVLQYEADLDRYEQLDRREEEMEVGAVGVSTDKAISSPAADLINRLVERVEKLTTEVGKMRASQSPQALMRRGTEPPRNRPPESPEVDR